MKIGFIGDIILSDQLEIDPILLEKLNETDFNVANLEAPFIDQSMKPRRGMGLHQLTHKVDLLKKLNVRLVSLANNHMMDFGIEAIEHTVKHVEQNGILCFGAGSDLKESLEPCQIDVNGETLELYGALQRYGLNQHFAGKHKGGIAPWDNNLFSTKKKAACRVLFAHWNREFEDYPEPVSKYYAEELTERFDLIVGSHSHCIQGVQKFRGVPIVHSLGNFALPHKSYFNTSLSGYPNKCYTGLVYVWDSNNEDNLLLTEMSKDGLMVGFRQEGQLHALDEVKSLSEPLALAYNSYRKFYKKNRIDKRPPLLSKSKTFNIVRFGIYVRSLQLFHSLEVILAKVLDLLGLRMLIKRILGLFIKRYN